MSHHDSKTLPATRRRSASDDGQEIGRHHLRHSDTGEVFDIRTLRVVLRRQQIDTTAAAAEPKRLAPSQMPAVRTAINRCPHRRGYSSE